MPQQFVFRITFGRHRLLFRRQLVRRRQDPRLAKHRIEIKPDCCQKLSQTSIPDRDSNPELGAEAAAPVHRVRPRVRRRGQARKRLRVFFRRPRHRQEAIVGGLRVALRRSREFESL